MPAAPATITCGSCGMQYDGTGMKSGVQFKCTQCGNMVVVGGAGGKPMGKPMGKATRGPGGPARAARPGMRGPAGPAGEPGQQPYGAPIPKKNNSMMVFGIIGGVVVVGMIALIVVMTTGQASSQRAAKEADEQRAKEEKEKQLKANEKVKADGEERRKTIDAGTQGGERIASLLTSGDLNALGAMFDWDVVQKDFVQQLEKQSKDTPKKADGTDDLDKNGKVKASAYEKFLNDPVFCEGEWEKREDGSPSGLYKGKMPRGSDGLRQRMMEYIEKMYAKANATMDTASMEKASVKGNDRFSMTIDGKLYMGRVCMIKSAAAGKLLNFFVGAQQGDTNVRILRFDDPQRMENLKQMEAKFQRKEQPQGADQFTNPDREKPKEGPGEEPGEEGPAEADLPEAKKTSAQCPQDLVNLFRDLRDGKEITNPQIRTLQDQSRTKADRKAFIGALLDVLIDKFKEGKRFECANISKALFAVWGGACGYPEKDCTYPADGNFDASNDYPLRVWYDFYNRYKT